MKKLFKRFILLLIIGILVTLGYVLYKTGFIGNSADTTSGNGSAEQREKNLDWLNGIRGYSDEDEEEDASATSTDDDLDENATSTDDGMAETETSTEEGMDENVFPDGGDADRERSVENLGKADALESTVYDHAFDKLVLFAELRSTGVALEWNATESEQFDEYKVVRSTTDENPYYPKSPTIKSLSNIASTTFFDSGVQPGMDYYYRICFTKKSGRPGCGNILKVSF